MIPLNSPELKRLSEFLGKYDLQSTVSRLAGLLTVPSLQANTLRIETVVHLAVAYCRGRRKPGPREIGNWLNRELGETWTAMAEDPVEDVFVTNVETPEGNRRVFEGTWGANDYFVQVVIDILDSRQAPQECRNLLLPAVALLKLSDCVAERVGVQRWHVEPSTPKGKVVLTPAIRLADRARAITFTNSELAALDINRDVLVPFILRDEKRPTLVEETVGHTSLERYPLIDFDDKLVLALPHAVSPAIRRFVLTELLQMGYLSAFSEALATLQSQQVEEDGLRDLKRQTDSLESPTPEGQAPSLQAWLLKYDIDKYLHVVLLHDRLDQLDAHDLSSFMKYPEEIGAGLRRYLSKVANHCTSLSDFTEGMTLLVMGGLGRGYALGFDSWPNQWRLSVIRISDFLMLASEPDRPVTRYLKCIKQKKWAEGEGVKLQSVDGDYNLYCYWRQSNYQMIPRELLVSPGSTLVVLDDYLSSVREETRNLIDRHVLQTTDGPYVSVRRVHSDSHFKSLRDRPIYGSLAHIRSGILAGAVETSRGPSWLVIRPREGDENIRRFLYQAWEGFIDLYDRLVFETESPYPQALAGPIEIRLDFNDVLIPEDYLEDQSGMVRGEPKVTVSFERRVAVVKFPPDFLQHFRQPENTGEKLVVRSIAEGLISLHLGIGENVEESILESLTNRIVSDSGVRILHAFVIYDPVEQLQERWNKAAIFLAQEDFAFSNLKLSEDCISSETNTQLVSKSECNDFLHKVVEKVWKQLQKDLKHFDRASVIRELLGVHEAIIHDRNHWRRTARAVLALYARTEDVFAVAENREADRVNAALAARSIVEMAVCECPESDGRQISQWDMDELLARAALLIDVATHSDALRNDLIKPPINLYPNGEYTIDRSFQETVIKPFSTAYHREGFEEAAAAYSKLYRNEPLGERTRMSALFPPEFSHAFQAEFGLTLDEVGEGISELLDLAIEHDSIVVETTLGDIKARLTSNRGLQIDASEAFFHAFGLFHRPAWDTPPAGYMNKDLYPWRFSRRLSLIVRPLLVLGKQDKDKVLFGVGSLRLGITHLLASIEEGHLPQEFFTSKEMKQYIGGVNNERGHAFAQSVATQLREKSWQTRNEVQMTELGAPAELGDVDVLAWRPNGKIQIIECKRLRLSRTAAEIAEICRRFRGEAEDELHKHVRRIKWIKANLTDLQRIVGFTPNPALIDDRLVTNTHVPMTYLESLPIEAGKIGPLE